MSNPASRILSWLPGPLIGLSLLSIREVDGGPGFLFLMQVAGWAFLVLTPAIQLFLLSTTNFKQEYAAACVIALVIVLVLLCIPAMAGFFNFF